MGDRKSRIVELLGRIRIEKHTSIDELASFFGISTATIRRDIKQLEQEHLVLQTVGGGVVYQQQNRDGAIDPRRSTQMMEQKIRIAEYCTELVCDHEDVIIGPGTTTFLAGKIMSGITDRVFRIITNSLELALETSTMPNIHTVMIGGEVWNKHSLGIQDGHDFFADCHHEYTAILSPDGLDCEHGATVFESRLVMMLRSIVSVSKKIILAVDSSKLGKVRYHAIAPIGAIQIVVTDVDAEASLVEAMRKQGVDVILV
jgi:DeoR family fructose operon transcriptional repressor